MDNRPSNPAASPVRQPLMLSPSAIKDFLSCRLRYALGYLTPLAPHERQPVSLLAVGEALHKTIADFHRLGGWGQVAREDLALMLGSHWPAGIYADASLDEANHEHALERLMRFYDNPFPQQVAMELGIEQRHSWKRFRRGILVSGRIDRACQLADGTVVLLDYKTGGKPRSTEALGRDPQALIYRSLAREAYGHLSPSRVLVAFYYLSVGAAVTLDYGADEFKAGWKRIEQVADAIRQAMSAVIAGSTVVDAFPPSIGDQCCRCPIRRQCDGLTRRETGDWAGNGPTGGAP